MARAKKVARHQPRCARISLFGRNRHSERHSSTVTLHLAQQTHVNRLLNALHVLLYFGPRGAFDQGRGNVVMAHGKLQRQLRNARLFLFAMRNGFRALTVGNVALQLHQIYHCQVTIMKRLRFIIAVTVVAGILGCSTPTSKNAIGHHPDFAATAMIEDGKRLFEEGKLDASEQKLLSVLAMQPNNRKAHYYLTLVKESQAKREASQRSRKFWGYYPTYPPKPIYQ